MIPLDVRAIGSRGPAAVPATLLPLVFDPDTGGLDDEDHTPAAQPGSQS